VKDKGNYIYENINELKIADMNGEDLNSKRYSFKYGQQVRFKPQVSGTLSGEDLSQLEFYWLMGKDTMSNTLELSVASEKLGIGIHSFVLHVLDKQTTLNYTKKVYINVIAGIVNGSYLLTETDNSECILSVIGPNEGDFFQHFREFAQVTLGSHPIKIQISRLPRWSIHIATSEGDYPIAALDLYTYLPIITYPKFSAVISGEPLLPTYMDLFTNIERLPGIILMNGKCRFVASGKVGAIINSDDSLDYNFGQKDVIISKLSFNGGILAGNFVGGFDHRNGRFRVFGNLLYGGGVSVYDDAFNPDDTKGHSYVAAAELPGVEAGQAKWRFLTRKGREFFLHNITIKANSRPEKAQVVVNKVVPEMESAANFMVYDKYWYFSLGRAIYRCSAETLDIAEVMKLPDDSSGDIVAWNFDIVQSAQAKRIGIATFNKNSNELKKGSYYLYNIATGEFDKTQLNVIDKAVSLEVL